MDNKVALIKSPSSWAGLAAFAAMLTNFLPVQYQWIAGVIAAGAAGVAVKLPEYK